MEDMSNHCRNAGSVKTEFIGELRRRSVIHEMIGNAMHRYAHIVPAGGCHEFAHGAAKTADNGIVLDRHEVPEATERALRGGRCPAA